MMQNTTLDTVIAFTATQLGVSEGEVTALSNISDLTSDSIKLFELLVAFESKYGIKVSYDDLVHIHTVEDIVRYLERVGVV